MPNLQRQMIDLKNKHNLEVRKWIYALLFVGIVSFGLGYGLGGVIETVLDL